MRHSNHFEGIAARITHLLINFCISESQIYQISSQIILNNLQSNTTLGYHFINSCSTRSNLLCSVVFPLYINLRVSPHTFVCNSILKAFAHSANPEKCPVVYSYVHRNCIPVNNYTFPFVLKAMADLKLIDEGASLHAQVKKFGFAADIYVGNSLLNLYAACGKMGHCRKVFDEMPLRDVVTWTTIISGFKNVGEFDNALITLNRMRHKGVILNRVTAVNALAACAGYGDLETGLWIHKQVRKHQWELDTILGTSLINMYGKCGRTAEAIRVFEEIGDNKNLYTWNAIIGALALSRNGEEAVKYFSRMETEEGIKPDEATLISVLSGCAGSGLLHKGQLIFSALISGKYEISASVKHYGCMIDLLLRCEKLDEALELMREMPFEGSVSMWGAVVGHCRAKGKSEISEVGSWKLVELEPDNCDHYVVLSNVYAELGRWSDVDRVRKLMKERQLQKDMGCSALQL